MDNYDIEYIEQKIFKTIIIKAKNNLNDECFGFKIDNLAEQLQINQSILNDNMSKLCKNLLKRNIEINHENGSREKISVLISIEYKNNTDLLLELNPEIKSYL